MLRARVPVHWMEQMLVQTRPRRVYHRFSQWPGMLFPPAPKALVPPWQSHPESR